MNTANPDKGQDPVVTENSRIAQQYDKRWFFYIEAITSATTVRLSLAPTGRVLDVGCGTGALLEKIARQLSRR